MTTKLVDFASPAAVRTLAQPPNPFLASAAFARFDEVADDAPEGSYTYAIVRSTPALTAAEVEVEAVAVEVVVRWGTSVLKVAHLSPVRSFWIGEAAEGETACDVAVPADRLGATRLPLVLVDAAGAARLVIPASATGTLALANEKAASLESALNRASATACSEANGAREIPLVEGTRAEIEIAGLSISIGAVHAGKKVAGRMAIDTKSLPAQGLSLLVHGALLAATAFFMPPLAMADEGGVSEDQAYMIQQALDASAMREPEATKNEEKIDDSQPAGSNGGQGQRSGGEEGKAGTLASLKTNGRFGIEGPKDNHDVMLSRSQALQEVQTFGMIAVLSGSQGPVAKWGDVAIGNDERTANGNMWGASIDDAGGANGLGLSGIGEGGGCRDGSCIGVGLGNVGTVGHGAGGGDGDGIGPGGFGHNHGRLAPTHHVGVPRMGGTTQTVNGHLPPEVIQRIVRQNFGRFRLCYENGLRTQPSLAGRVSVRFVIGRDGSVSNTANGGSDLPDSGVVSCVTRAFYGLSFPQPDSGIVTVVYPITFSPG